MKRRFRLGVEQREVHSWNPFAEEIVETRNEVRLFVRYPGQRRHKTEQVEAEGRSKAERAEVKAAAYAEKAHAKMLRLSGNRFEVNDRDGHHRGYFPTYPPAAARADEVDGFVTDRLEGLRVYSSREQPDRDAIPDDGTQAWEMDW